MNEAIVREKLLEISETLGKSKETETPLVEGIYESDSPTQMDNVIDTLRTRIKYLLFDLEASRRENRYLRQMLEMRPPRSSKDGKDDNPNNGWR